MAYLGAWLYPSQIREVTPDPTGRVMYSPVDLFKMTCWRVGSCDKEALGLVTISSEGGLSWIGSAGCGSKESSMAKLQRKGKNRNKIQVNIRMS